MNSVRIFVPQDCETGIKDFFNSKLYIIGYVGIGIAGVMVSQAFRRTENKQMHSFYRQRECLGFFFFLLLKLCFPLNRSLGWSSVWCSVVLSETAGRSSKLDPRPSPPPSPKDCIAFRSNVDLCPSPTQGPGKYQYFLSTTVLTRLPWPDILLYFSEYFYIYLLSQVANILLRLQTIHISSGNSMNSAADLTICQIVSPHLAIWQPVRIWTRILSQTCQSFFRTALTLTPSAVGNCSPREHSEVKAAEFACTCAHMSARTHERSNVVLHETAALKKKKKKKVGGVS